MDGQGCTCGAAWYGECGCGADWTDSEKEALKAELAEARKDVARMDWLSLKSVDVYEYDGEDNSFDDILIAGCGWNLRDMCDIHMPTTPPVDTSDTQRSS